MRGLCAATSTAMRAAKTPRRETLSTTASSERVVPEILVERSLFSPAMTTSG
jgi:hypothetical protein